MTLCPTCGQPLAEPARRDPPALEQVRAAIRARRVDRWLSLRRLVEEPRGG